MKIPKASRISLNVCFIEALISSLLKKKTKKSTKLTKMLYLLSLRSTPPIPVKSKTSYVLLVRRRWKICLSTKDLMRIVYVVQYNVCCSLLCLFLYIINLILLRYCNSILANTIWSFAHVKPSSREEFRCSKTPARCSERGVECPVGSGLKLEMEINWYSQ